MAAVSISPVSLNFSSPAYSVYCSKVRELFNQKDIHIKSYQVFISYVWKTPENNWKAPGKEEWEQVNYTYKMNRRFPLPSSDEELYKILKAESQKEIGSDLAPEVMQKFQLLKGVLELPFESDVVRKCLSAYRSGADEENSFEGFSQYIKKCCSKFEAISTEKELHVLKVSLVYNKVSAPDEELVLDFEF